MATARRNTMLSVLLLVQGIFCQSVNSQIPNETFTEGQLTYETAADETGTTEFIPSNDTLDTFEYLIENTTLELERDYGIRYYLYTRSHPTNYLVLGNSSMLEDTDFSIDRPTVFLIHGFTGSGITTSVTLIRNALLYTKDVNVVAVHWEELAKGPDYQEAVSNTELVARNLAETIEHLVTEEGVKLGSLHVMGFSLGAQVAGIAGSLIRIGKLPRITALDPAGPSFHKRSNMWRLDPSDAEFVLVLHTSGELVSFDEPLGHADFYPNGGKSPQPGCLKEVLKLVCSHLIAPLYFTEAIYNETAFAATRCESWLEYTEGLCQDPTPTFLGLHTPSSTRGLFFLRTNAEEPYGRGVILETVKVNTLDEAAAIREGRTVQLKEGKNDIYVAPISPVSGSSNHQPFSALFLIVFLVFVTSWFINLR